MTPTTTAKHGLPDLKRAAAVGRIVNRFAAALIGGYVFAYGFTALSALGAFRAGLPFFQAQTLAWMLGLVVYLGALLWGFTPRSGWRAWLVLGGGGAAMATAAWHLSRLAS